MTKNNEIDEIVDRVFGAIDKWTDKLAKFAEDQTSKTKPDLKIVKNDSVYDQDKDVLGFHQVTLTVKKTVTAHSIEEATTTATRELSTHGYIVS